MGVKLFNMFFFFYRRKKDALTAISGVAHPQREWHAAVFYPFGHLTPMTYVDKVERPPIVFVFIFVFIRESKDLRLLFRDVFLLEIQEVSST
jgi:hypothetical protein